MFDYRRVKSLAQVQQRVGGGPPGAEPIPVLPALQGLLPGGLPRGQVITVDAMGALPLVLVAGAVPAGDPTVDLWCGMVGLPECGMLAAAGMGANLDRLVLVDQPGERWADVVATLLPATGVVLVQPPGLPPTGVIRRLTALARQHGAALVVVGPWEGARLRLQVTSSLWTGLDHGHGHLQGRRVKVVADGRGAGGRPRSAWLWLPGPDGSVASADLEVVDASEAVGALEVAG
jgi:hypothetical protein